MGSTSYVITSFGEKFFLICSIIVISLSSRWLNSHDNFSYVSHMGLKEPEDDGYVMLSKSAISLGITKLVKDVSKGAAKKRIPNLEVAGTRFLKGFRDGKYGPINLDVDSHNMASASRIAR